MKWLSTRKWILLTAVVFPYLLLSVLLFHVMPNMDTCNQYSCDVLPDMVSVSTLHRNPREPVNTSFVSVSIALHDSSSLPSQCFKRDTSSGFNVTIDAFSVGSESRLSLLQAQASTWGSHGSIRNFFGLTERDDADPTCASKLTKQDMNNISNYCSNVAWQNRRGFKLRYLQSVYARPLWFQQHNKTPGWLCAQQRFAHTMAKMGRFYRKETIPDFVFIQDDDTFYNMPNMISFLQSLDTSQPIVEAGCLVRWPTHAINFSFPIGGYGFFLSRGAIQQLVQPIYCNTTVKDNLTTLACNQIADNMAGEKRIFLNGMSISDLIDAHAINFPIAKYQQWTRPGYCFHGDWVLGYFINYFGIGTEFYRPDFHSNPKVRIEQHLGHSYNGDVSGNCLNEGWKACGSLSHACHRLGSSEMHRVFTSLNDG
jgi:hypothetical protein